MTKESSTISKPVDYYKLYNLYNKDNKNNRENHVDFVVSGIPGDAIASSPSEPQVVSGEVTPPNDLVTDEAIERAIIQLFDNGEDSKRRFKCKIRLNVHGEDVKNSPEFIASLTKDWGNFKKYIPRACRSEIIEDVNAVRKHIKETYGVWPYIGKFHNKTTKQKADLAGVEIEPWTYAVIYWDSVTEVWTGLIRFYGWHHKFTLENVDLTAKQIKSGVVGQHLFINPIHDKRQRPMTWGERRMKGLA